MNPDVEPPKDDDEPPKVDKKNLARNIFRNFKTLTKDVMQARPRSMADILALVERRRSRTWGENLTVEERQERLFAFEAWDNLKMAVLNSRCLPLPESKLPASQTELVELCKNLLDRTGDGDIFLHFVDGWRDDLLAEPALKAFCGQLWKTRVSDDEFYRAVVSGMHGTAVSYLVRKGIPVDLTPEDAVRLIYRMALIWCAHDVQATAARARRSMTNPMEGLMAGDGKRMRVGTVLAVWRPVYRMLSGNSERYRTNKEIRGGKNEAKPTRHEEVKKIRDELMLRLNGATLAGSTRRERDGLFGEIRNFMETQDDLFWNELRNDETSKEIANLQISQLWHSRLTPLQMVAVSVIRLLQMEAILERRIAGMYRHPLGGETISPPLLHFSEADLPRGWRKRALQLVDDLRRVILEDSDHGSRREEVKEGDGVRSHDETYIDGALGFLNDALQQPLPNDPAVPLKGVRRTVSLLNVCAVVRLMR
jgi:hypothetical protein